MSKVNIINLHKPPKIKLQSSRECWVCGTMASLERHHVYGGANRRLSEQYGLTVYLCHNHHNENIPGDAGVHSNPVLDRRLKQYAQAEFEKVYGREAFMKLFGRNYL